MICNVVKGSGGESENESGAGLKGKEKKRKKGEEEGGQGGQGGRGGTVEEERRVRMSREG